MPEMARVDRLCARRGCDPRRPRRIHMAIHQSPSSTQRAKSFQVQGLRMSVKTLLAELAAGFISLQHVLTRMTQTDGSTYQEAAIVLYRLLWTADKDSRPAWYEYTPSLQGSQVASDGQAGDAWACLQYVGQHRTPRTSRFDLPTFGFDECKIIEFLEKYGISIGHVSTSTANAGFSEWERVLSLLPSLSVPEAASAFAGIDLSEGSELPKRWRVLASGCGGQYWSERFLPRNSRQRTRNQIPIGTGNDGVSLPSTWQHGVLRRGGRIRCLALLDSTRTDSDLRDALELASRNGRGGRQKP